MAALENSAACSTLEMKCGLLGGINEQLDKVFSEVGLTPSIIGEGARLLHHETNYCRIYDFGNLRPIPSLMRQSTEHASNRQRSTQHRG